MSAANCRNEALIAALEVLKQAILAAPTATAPAAPAPAAGPVTLPWSVLLWHPDVPDETLLTVEQLADATGWSKAAIYKRTSKWHRDHGTVAPLPHVRVAGSLRFPVGALRAWLREQTETVVGREPVVVSERHRRGAA